MCTDLVIVEKFTYIYIKFSRSIPSHSAQIKQLRWNLFTSHCIHI